MRIFVFFSLIILQFFVSEIIAQTEFSGVIQAAGNNNPIEGAIVRFGNMQNDYVISDKNGAFLIPDKHNDIIDIRCIGYLPKSVLFDNLVKENTVLLTLSPIELNPVEITPADVNIILTRAITYLKNRLSSGSYLNYLLHFKQKEEYSGEEQEIELNFAARLEKVKDKNLVFTLRKIGIKNIKSLPANATSHSLKKNIFNIEYHLKAFDSNYYLDKYKITKSETLDDFIILSASPKDKQKKEYVDYRFYISRADTVLHAINIDVDYKNSGGDYKSFGTRKYKINKMNTVIEFIQKDGRYELAECLQILEILLEYGDGRKEKIISYSDSKLIGDMPLPSLQNLDKLPKLDGHSRRLFSK